MRILKYSQSEFEIQYLTCEEEKAKEMVDEIRKRFPQVQTSAGTWFDKKTVRLKYPAPIDPSSEAALVQFVMRRIPFSRPRQEVVESIPKKPRRYVSKAEVDVGLEVETLIGLADNMEDLVKMLMDFLLEFQPDQVIIDPAKRVYQLFDVPTLHTPESRKAIIEFFSKFHYSVEHSYRVFRNKIQMNPKQKQVLNDPKFATSYDKYDLFPETTEPYNAAIVYVGVIHFWLLVNSYKYVCLNLKLKPNVNGRFLWLIPMRERFGGFTMEEIAQMREISDPAKRISKALKILERSSIIS